VLALSPDHRYLAVLNNGYGSYTSDQKQSIAILDLASNRLTDFPESLMASGAAQTFFHGLAFSSDGRHLYASVGSLTDPLGEKKGNVGNGILIYDFDEGKIHGSSFLKMPPRPKPQGKRLQRDDMKNVTFPAGLAVVPGKDGDSLLLANNLSDEAVLLDLHGQVKTRFDLSIWPRMPSSLPFGVVVTKDGSTGFVSLWNASRIAELDLASGRVLRMIELSLPTSPNDAGSHPTAMLLSPDEHLLYVALSNADEVVVVDRANGVVVDHLSTKLPGQVVGGSAPNALALSSDGSRLFVANAISDSVSVFDLKDSKTGPKSAAGFIPTQVFPTALAVFGNDLFIASAKGTSTGPITTPLKKIDGVPDYPYLVPMIHGSLARVHLQNLDVQLASYTEQVLASNRIEGKQSDVPGKKLPPIRHVIYVLKENRTYDQILGDLGVGNGDASLTMYGEAITPNEHKLARQFGVLDNFYDSGDVSGDGHVWSTAATVTDYTEKVWPLDYRGHERTYDFQGEVLNEIPLEDGNPDVNEPSTGYLWTNLARNKLTYRVYGEFITTKWCNGKPGTNLPTEGPPHPEGDPCPKSFIDAGEKLPPNVGDPHDSASPYPWPVPIFARSIATKPELREHFDTHYPDFETSYPDQLRADEFLNEFGEFAASRKQGRDTMPQFILLYLPDDHTGGVKKGYPTPSASVADNDLALGRVVEAVSHSEYWNDTAIFVIEDDAQDGPDHVDAHRSTAFVISKFSPLRIGEGKTVPVVDSAFYTTINMLRTMEILLGLPPMNNNDARAAFMGNLLSGPGDQPPFTADRRNLDNKLIFQVNAKDSEASARLDFSHPDASDAALLNSVLWRDRMGMQPMPAPRHSALFELRERLAFLGN
ncbi:MAG TPA: beta-propeller fold lactonase family protein, partial [Terriglobales bacterium]|nr:beta-propeller fold lactonase family protein [Terriglobales bacterium]